MFHVQNLATKVEGLQVKPGNKLLQITVTKWQHPNFYQRVLIEQCTTVLSYFFIRNRLSSLPGVSIRTLCCSINLTPTGACHLLDEVLDLSTFESERIQLKI